MDNFDQLIKEKIEKKTYEYKPEYWSAFKQYSHIHRMSLLSKIAISAGSILVIGSGLFFVLQDNGKESASPENDSTSAVCDTIINEINHTVPVTEPVYTETVSTVSPKHNTAIEKPKPETASEETILAEENKPSSEQTEKKITKVKKEEKAYVRGVVITVDSNERGDQDAFPSFNHSVDEIR